MYDVYLKICQSTVEPPRPNINIRTFYYRNIVENDNVSSCSPSTCGCTSYKKQ